MIIRQENKSDIEQIFQVNKQAFGQENEAKLVNLLRASKAFISELSLVAESNNQIAGHILFSKIVIVDDKGHEFESLALAPMAVMPAFQRRGIGEQLIREGINKARSLNYTSVTVLGHEHYYPRFGFTPAEKWHIKPPFNVPANVFMAMELVCDGLKGVSGIVRYSEPFEKI